MNTSMVGLIGVLFLIIVATRALPFLFSNLLSGKPRFEAVGRQLPAYIMMLLVIYELRPAQFFIKPYALPELVSLALLSIVHIWRRHVLLSMLVGTLSYIMIYKWGYQVLI